MILEADDLRKAINILNEGFFYDGITHKNLLKFYGCYLNEVNFLTDFYTDDNEKEEDEENNENENKISLKKLEGLNNRGVTYQVGLITEEFQQTSLYSYFSYFQEKDRQISEHKLWSVLVQLASLLSTCQDNGVQHNDLRPSSIFVRKDHKTLALSYLGSAKFIGKWFYNKEGFGYLAPKLIACFGESLREEELHKHERTYKDDVYSLGISLLELALIGSDASLPDVT